MEQQNISPETIQDAAFQKRRNQKNWIVMALIAGGVALVWSVTMIKIQNGMEMAHPIGLSVEGMPQKTGEEGSDAR